MPHGQTGLTELSLMSHGQTGLMELSHMPHGQTSHSWTSLMELSLMPHRQTSLMELSHMPHRQTSLMELSHMPHGQTSLMELSLMPHSQTSHGWTSLMELSHMPHSWTSLMELSHMPHGQTGLTELSQLDQSLPLDTPPPHGAVSQSHGALSHASQPDPQSILEKRTIHPTPDPSPTIRSPAFKKVNRRSRTTTEHTTHYFTQRSPKKLTQFTSETATLNPLQNLSDNHYSVLKSSHTIRDFNISSNEEVELTKLQAACFYYALVAAKEVEDN